MLLIPLISRKNILSHSIQVTEKNCLSEKDYSKSCHINNAAFSGNTVTQLM